MQKISVYLIILLSLTTNLVAQKRQDKVNFSVQNEKFILPNGLEVIFHIDRSDPIVSVALTAHVGSAREITGRTGFAHLFEHLLFLESENLGKGGLDKMSARIGGSGANGSTNRDRTNYFQTVPNDALEKMIWAEADKLGWFINTVTEEVLAKEKQVVKNEKRQSYDNNPYGHTSYVIDQHLYPADHPYHWQVIGSLEDLQNATLQDVKDFFNRWYVPNNVTLVVAGDFDPVQAKAWVEKYFSEIKRGDPIPEMPKRPGVVDKTVKLYHEDNFARLPELTMAWPAVEEYHPDSYALNILADYLSQGKKAPLYRVIVEDKNLAPRVSIYNRGSELAGQFQLSVRAFQGKNLDEVANAIQTAFTLFEKEGIPQKDLDRIKAGLETQFYNSLLSVQGKGFQLAEYNIFAGDPNFLEKDFNNIFAVTTADVVGIYNKYIKNKNHVATSFVPKGSKDLALDGSKKAEVVEEKIEQDQAFEAAENPTNSTDFVRTPSSFDRSKEPPAGKTPSLETPKIWEEKLGNGLRLYAIENTEVPLVQFEIVIDGGLLLEDTSKVGVSNLLALMMTQGTKNKTPIELEEAIQQIGARIYVRAGEDDIRISANTLAKNYDATLALVQEILLEPRWDTAEFSRIKQSVLSQIRQQEANPGSIAENHYNLLIYGNNNIRSKNLLGSIQSVNKITMNDLKEYYSKYLSPSVSKMHLVGALNQAEIIRPLKSLISSWKAVQVKIPTYPTPSAPNKSMVYFYDVSDAKQSVIRIGYPALAVTHPDYYPATVMNYILGGGGFASQLTQQLREGKGYTYGIRSNFSGSISPGPFTIASNVRTNVTLESAQLIKDILNNYGKNFTGADLETTKSFLIKSNARAFETAGAKLNLLDNISNYGWPYDYVKKREETVKTMSVQAIKNLAEKYLNTNQMIWLIVGDAKTQLPRMKALGFDEPVLLK